GAVGHVRSVVVDCSDPEVSAEFWEQVLGYTRIRTDDAGDGADWVTIGPPDRASDRISFQRVEGYQPTTWPEGPRPQQLHLDLRGQRSVRAAGVHGGHVHGPMAMPDANMATSSGPLRRELSQTCATEARSSAAPTSGHSRR